MLTFRTNLLDLYSFRQTQTAFTIREFMMGNWSFSSPLPILGPPWAVPFEFPLFQAIAALNGNVFQLAADSAGRITGLAFFIVTGLLLAIFDSTLVWHCGSTIDLGLLSIFSIQYSMVNCKSH
jgi:hypothetical protein